MICVEKVKAALKGRKLKLTITRSSQINVFFATRNLQFKSKMEFNMELKCENILLINKLGNVMWVTLFYCT